MQKSAFPGQKMWPGTFVKTLLVMKLAIVIILATALQVQAVPVTGQHVTLNLKQTEIRKVFKLIEGDGYYRFVYNSELKGLRNKVDFTVKNLPIAETLAALLPAHRVRPRPVSKSRALLRSSD